MSYLALTHKLFNAHARFLVDKYLQLNRAGRIAEFGGDVEAACEGLSERGRARLRRRFDSFVEGFQSSYGLRHEDAVALALGLGKLSLNKSFLGQREGAGSYQIHGVMDQLTDLRGKKLDAKCFADWPDEDKEFLRTYFERGHLLFERNTTIAIGGDWHRLLVNRAAQHFGSYRELSAIRQKQQEEWASARETFRQEQADFFRRAKPLFDYQESRRTNPDDKPFHIEGRAIKGIRRLTGGRSVEGSWRTEGLWGVAHEGDRESRIARRKELIQLIRDEDNERFGDHHLFCWLAEHADDWPEFAADFERLLEWNSEYRDGRRSKAIRFTWPHWSLHPLWAGLEEATDDSKTSKHYRIDIDSWTMQLLLVVPTSDVINRGRLKPEWNSESVDLPALSDAEIDSIVDALDPSLVSYVPIPVALRPDARLLRSLVANPEFDSSKQRARGEKAMPYLLSDPLIMRAHHLPDGVPTKLGGLKLVFKPRPVTSRSSVYVYFSAEHQLPRPGKRPKVGEMEGRVMTIDLGLRHGAFACVSEYDGTQKGDSAAGMPGTQIWAGRIVAPGGRHHRHLEMHERTRQHRQQRAQTAAAEGKQRSLARGQRFEKELQEHARNMRLDTSRQLAHAILEKAVELGVSVIVHEALNARQSTENTRRQNRSWRAMRVRSLLGELGSYRSTSGSGKHIGVNRAGNYYGIHTWEVSPEFTSQVCSYCGQPGVRYSEIPAAGFKRRDGSRIWQRRGHSVDASLAGRGLLERRNSGALFCCSNRDCHVKKINADYNAARNLHRKMLGVKMLPQLPKADSARRKYWQTVEQCCVDKANLVRLADLPKLERVYNST